jgi:hypothetical protein
MRRVFNAERPPLPREIAKQAPAPVRQNECPSNNPPTISKRLSPIFFTGYLSLDKTLTWPYPSVTQTMAVS